VDSFGLADPQSNFYFEELFKSFHFIIIILCSLISACVDFGSLIVVFGLIIDLIGNLIRLRFSLNC
jgi:hypothetical protein